MERYRVMRAREGRRGEGDRNVVMKISYLAISSAGASGAERSESMNIRSLIERLMWRLIWSLQWLRRVSGAMMRVVLEGRRDERETERRLEEGDRKPRRSESSEVGALVTASGSVREPMDLRMTASIVMVFPRPGSSHSIPPRTPLWNGEAVSRFGEQRQSFLSEREYTTSGCSTW
jgi:hypothetical protein